MVQSVVKHIVCHLKQPVNIRLFQQETSVIASTVEEDSQPPSQAQEGDTNRWVTDQEEVNYEEAAPAEDNTTVPAEEAGNVSSGVQPESVVINATTALLGADFVNVSAATHDAPSTSDLETVYEGHIQVLKVSSFDAEKHFE